MRDLLVLSYHAVSDSWPASMSLAAERLEEQVASLLARGYSPATFSDAIRARTSGRTLAVTFDDGYRSVIDLGLPVLSSLGVPATLFVPTSFVGTARPMAWPGVDRWLASPHESELVPMGWDELGRLQEAGWEIGSHTRSHPRLTQVDDAQLADELESSRTMLDEKLGQPCTSIAYPYGDVDRRVAEAAVKAGYEAGAGLAGYEIRASRMQWPRVGAYREDSRRRFAVKTSWLARRISLARIRYALTRG
jgi:peptidoglycan/xylan/chitin deacetylase (PgdA/CDA1 family)